MRNVPERLWFVAAAALLLTGGGCESFESHWKRMNQFPLPATSAAGAPRLEGLWEGSWHSDKDDHEGTLRAIITANDDGTHHAWFKAVYSGFIPFEQKVTLTSELRDGKRWFTGEADLGGMAGGTYQYDGWVDANRYFSTFTAKDNHGTFEMRRVIR